MSTDTAGMDNELSATEARDHFSERINRAHHSGEITFVTRGRHRQRAAAIVPAALVEHYEELLDEHDARIAAECLADIEAGREATISIDEAERELSL
ncbi:type II toxin-antitoxin system Phd/YefM family antitoxin [Marinitenerispora sediminis]|nr:antitoxin of toxin-antitoxin stability system [Marinitenerispora sediminis]